MHPSIDPLEARKVAEFAHRKSVVLAQEYRAIRPAWFHNVLVNYGYRERGLCFQWSNDLFFSLLDLRTSSLDIHLIVSKMDTPREHNSIAVTPRGHSFTNGIVLDAWRGSGRLWFGPVAGDKYEWKLLPEDRINPHIKKRLIEVNPLYSRIDERKSMASHPTINVIEGCCQSP